MPAPTKSNAAMSPDGGTAQPAVPKTELQELQMKAGEVTDEVNNFYLYYTNFFPRYLTQLLFFFKIIISYLVS